jgi:alpha-galactosidase/6-phospho-beta-glucosidase family protein
LGVAAHRGILVPARYRCEAAKGEGRPQQALQALLLDDMAIVPERAEAMLDELLAASRPMLPQFA